MECTATQPAPSPSSARPPAISSSAAVAFAVTVGWRVVRLVTPAPISMRSVASAERFMAAYASFMPSWWSMNHSASKPWSSTARASSPTAASGSRGLTPREIPNRLTIVSFPCSL